MPSDPSGRYKGSNYDPHWSQNRSHATHGPGGPSRFSSDSNSAGAVARNRLNGYTNHYGANGPASAPLQPQMTGSSRGEYGYPNGHGQGNANGYGSGRRSPRSPSPTKRGPAPTGLTPTGPASMKSTLPLKQEAWSSNSSRNDVIDATTSEHTTAPESQPDPKVERASSTNSEMNSPSYKVHPSRLNLVPHATPSVSSPLNPARTPTTASANTPSRDGSASRASRPAPLNLTPADTPNQQVKTPATATWSPSLVLSPATKSPLDSLDKLRRFKEQVAASRKSVNSMSGLEMSKLAQVAETFLKSQDPAASDHAYEELVKLTGSREASSSQAPEPAQKPPPPPTTPAPPVPPARDGAKEIAETVQSAAARAAILKERLLASKRDGTSQSPRDREAKRADSNVGDPNASTGTKRDRDHGPETENDEQKRYRAAVWAHQKPAEPEKKAQHQERHSARSEREEGEWDGYDSRGSAPQLQRMERQLSLHERISDRTGGLSNGHDRGHGNRRASPSPDRRDRHRRDDHARPSHAQPERHHEAHSVPAPRGPSGYQGRDTTRHEYTHTRPPASNHDTSYRSAAPIPQVHQRESEDAAYEARRRARMISQSSPTRPEFPRDRPSAPPAPQTYARAVAEPRGYREDPYARPLASEYHRPQEVAPVPAPAPAPVAAPAAAIIDPATVLATLDVLKAQIASLEKLLPAALPAVIAPVVAPPVRTEYVYGYDRDHRPLPPPPPHHEHHEHGYGHGREYAPPPPPPPQRGYVYERPPHPGHQVSPTRESQPRIGTEPWLNRPPARKERGGPYRERGGYKGRDDYHDTRHDDHGHGRGHGHGERGGRGRGRGGGRGGGRGDARGRGRGRGGR